MDFVKNRSIDLDSWQMVVAVSYLCVIKLFESLALLLLFFGGLNRVLFSAFSANLVVDSVAGTATVSGVDSVAGVEARMYRPRPTAMEIELATSNSSAEEGWGVSSMLDDLRIRLPPAVVYDSR